MEKTHKQQVEHLTNENDKILSAALQEQIAAETSKLDTIFKSAIQAQ